MTEISDAFRDLKENNEAALIAYVTVGDPHVSKTAELVGALVEGGVDIVELGIPFSDPIADGPTIQNAVLRSLTGGCRPPDVFEVASTIRERYKIPLVAMTYYNPVFRIGVSVSKTRKEGGNFRHHYSRPSDRGIKQLQKRMCFKRDGYHLSRRTINR